MCIGLYHHFQHLQPRRERKANKEKIQSRSRDIAEEVEHMPSVWEVLASNPSTHTVPQSLPGVTLGPLKIPACDPYEKTNKNLKAGLLSNL